MQVIKPWHAHNEDIKKQCDLLDDADDDFWESTWQNVKAEDFVFMISANPEDCCGEEGDIIVCLSPYDTFQMDGCQYDGHIDTSIFDKNNILSEMMECTYEIDKSVAKTPEEARKILLEMGLKENFEFSKSLGGIIFENMNSGTGPKLTTDICKDAIIKNVKSTNEMWYSIFKKTDSLGQVVYPTNSEIKEYRDNALELKNWKRISKFKDEDKCVIRVFDCKPFDDQVRAYVKSNKNDTEILGIKIIGE